MSTTYYLEQEIWTGDRRQSVTQIAVDFRLLDIQSALRKHATEAANNLLRRNSLSTCWNSFDADRVVEAGELLTIASQAASMDPFDAPSQLPSKTVTRSYRGGTMLYRITAVVDQSAGRFA